MIISSGLQTPPNLQYVGKTLRQLNLSKNNITSFPWNYFEHCDLLTSLMLPHNLIQALPDMSYLAYSLESLQVDHNFLSRCGNLCNNRFFRLERVRMCYNNLEEFDLLRALAMWVRVMDISICHNHIRTLAEPIELYVTEPPVWLVAYGNPFHCSSKAKGTYSIV